MERLFAAAALAAMLAVTGCDRAGGGGGEGKGGTASAEGEAAESDSAGAEELGDDVSVDTQKVAADSAK